MKRNVFFILLCGLTALTTTVKAQNPEAYQSVNKEQITSENDWKFRFGGYGEMLARRMDYGLNRWGTGTATGNKKIDHNDISLPRFVLALDYKFNKKWMLGAEIEFESGGTGAAYELEATGRGIPKKYGPSSPSLSTAQPSTVKVCRGFAIPSGSTYT